MKENKKAFYKFWSWTTKHDWSWVLIGYIVINIIFMNAFWRELVFDQSKVGARYGEVFTAEWAMDQVYRNIISGNNPFVTSPAILYPFGTDYVSTDSGNGFLFLFLRSFLSPHQSLSVIVAFGLLLASLGMYVLLRKLKIKRMTSFVIGSMFAYMTFLMPRLGHLNYMAIYVFPWMYYFLISLLQKNSIKQKIIYSVFVGFLFVVTLYANAYYFIMLCISFLSLGLYLLFLRKGKIFKDIFSKYIEIITAFTAILFFGMPYFLQIYKTRLFEGLPKTEGWGGAIQFSSDLFGYIIPSIYSFFMHPVANFWGKNFVFAGGIFEQFTYPGMMIISAYLFLVFLFLRKKLPTKFQKNIAPFFIVSIVFWVLTLGPFLHVFGHWALTVDDGIRIVVPLPYILLHYVPFLANIRVPARLIVAFIFFAYIVTAYLIDFFLSSKSKKFIRFFYIGLFAVFIIDHYFYITTPATRFIPYRAYEYLKEQPDNMTVFQIPSTVRDGFVYFGSPDAIEFIEGQTIHQKPMVGGYLGRVPSFKRDYYVRNPFLGYIGRLIDSNISANGGLDRSDLAEWSTIGKEKSIDAIDFLDIKYILLDSRPEYSATLSAILSDFGYEKKLQDEYMSVIVREPSKKEFLSVQIGSPDDDMYLGAGWGARENKERWSGKRMSVMFKVENPRDFDLSFQAASFHTENNVDIYVNEVKVGTVSIPTNKKVFEIPFAKKYFKSGINTIHFISDNAYRPSDIIPQSEDIRAISNKFYNISLK